MVARYTIRILSVLVLLAQFQDVLSEPGTDMGVTSSSVPPGDAFPGGCKGHVPLDVEDYPVAPPELELQQVHIYARHGERSPVGVRMSEPPASIPEHWMFCNTARHFRAAVASTNRTSTGLPSTDYDEGVEETLPTRRVVERVDGTVQLGQCLLGELTDIGRQSTFLLGHSLRRLYIDRLGFLPDVVRSNDEIYLRSTNVPRTIESLQQIVHGLYPVSKSADNFVPHLRIRNNKEENLFGNTACGRLRVLLIAYAQTAAKTWNQTLAPLDSKLSKFIGGKPVRLDGVPRASGILDTVKAAAAHGVPLPPEFHESGVVDLIESAVVDEWFADKDEEVRRLGMGPLLSDLSQKMQAKAEHGEEESLPKILIHSAHDTSLAALCNTLGTYDEKWPAFTASLTFELFRRKQEAAIGTTPWQTVLTPPSGVDASTDHYVRVRYQNKNLALPLCASEGKHLPGSPEFCTLAAFRERVLELTPADWDAECTP